MNPTKYVKSRIKINPNIDLEGNWKTSRDLEYNSGENDDIQAFRAGN